MMIRSSALHSWHTGLCVEGVPLRCTSILRLRRAPSPRGCSYHMQYCTFISQPAHFVAYERGKDFSTSLPMTIRNSALHSCHTGRCAEGCLFEAHLSCAFSKGLLVWHVIPCFRFSSYAFTRIRVNQRAHGFASDDDTDRCASSCHSILRRLQGALG